MEKSTYQQLFSTENIDFIHSHLKENINELALKISERKDINVPFVLQQIEGQQRMLTKVPFWTKFDSIVYPHKLALEQCSGQKAAEYKQSVVKRIMNGKFTSMVDLTGGMGIDFSFISPLFTKATYVEQQTSLCSAAHHNFEILGLHHAEVIEMDAIEYLKTMATVDLIYIDPARRDACGRKVFLPSDCLPNVVELMPLLLEKAKIVVVKLSTMLDLAGALKEIPQTKEVHIFSENGECKDLLLVVDSHTDKTVEFVCKGDRFCFKFTSNSEKEAIPIMAETLKQYLYEPDAALLKAGAYRLIATRFGVKKLHPNSHLYTGETLIQDFPGRCFKIIAHSGFSKKNLKETLGSLSKANLTIRNFPSTVAELRKRLKLADGGNDYLFATTLANNQKTIIHCTKIV